MTADVPGRDAELPRTAAQKRISSVSDRDELFAGTMSDLDRNSTDQRQRLLDSNARMEASNARLKEAIAIGNETGAGAVPRPWWGARGRPTRPV